MCLDCGCVLSGTGTPNDDHGDPQHITLDELAAAAGADQVSVVQAAANILATAQLVADVQVMDEDVAKAATQPQRYVLGIAYQAGRDPRIAKGQDGGRDYFTAEELEKAAWSFLQAGPQVGVFHVDGTEGAATVVESYIYRNPEPWVLADDLVVKNGDWVMGAILDERAWRLYEAGKLNGWSPQGTAKRRRVVAQATG